MGSDSPLTRRLIKVIASLRPMGKKHHPDGWIDHFDGFCQAGGFTHVQKNHLWATMPLDLVLSHLLEFSGRKKTIGSRPESLVQAI